MTLREYFDHRFDDLCERLGKVEQTVSQIDEGMRGTKDQRTTGLFTRLDRLEQSEGRRSKWIWTAMAAGIVACVEALARATGWLK